jgi:hypothetical protein
MSSSQLEEGGAAMQDILSFFNLEFLRLACTLHSMYASG